MLEYILSLFLISPSAAANNYNSVVAALQKLAQENPHTAQIFNLGMSDAGVMIVGLKIGDGPVADLVVGTHHGNEYGSTAVALGAAEAFSKDPIAGHTVYVIPVLNISGYNAREREEQVGRQWIDDNRDYEGPCVNTTPFRSKATKALAEFIQTANINTSATLHTFSPAVLYPFGFSTRDTGTPDDATFIGLSKAATVESGYDIGNSKELLYAADGAFEDYAYWKHGIWSLLFEMGVTHDPNPSQMKEMVAENVPGLRRFFQMAPQTRAINHIFTGKCDRNVRQRSRME
jgi:carboxypeptidase T